MASGSSTQAKNETRLTVEQEPKVAKLKRFHEKRPKLAFLPYVKCAVTGFLSLLLLCCGVFSKLSVVVVAKCQVEDGAARGRRFIMLVLILMVPQFVGFVYALWGSIRKKNRPWPTNKAIIVCVISSVLEVIGLTVFTMVALTSEHISSVELIAVMTCVSMVPSLWQILKSYHREEINTSKRKFLSFACGFVQLAGLVVVIFVIDDENVKKFRYSLISLVLISIAWLPKMRKLQSKPRPNPMEEDEGGIDINENEESLTHPGQFLRIKTARKKATIICESLKLLLTPFISYLVAYLFEKVHWSELADGFEYLDKIRDTTFAYFLVNIFVSFVGYITGILTCSMAIQKFGFALPLTLMTPVSFFIAIGCEKIWSSSDWLYDQSPSTSEKQLIVAICVCVFVFLAQFSSTTYYIWHSQDFIMANERQLFWVPSYNGVLLEQNLLLNRKNEVTDEFFVNQRKLTKDSCIFICTTMYHEADYEMEQLLNSIRRVDIARQESKRRIESHVWFDGAVKRNVLNSYVLQLISLVNKTLNVKVNGCTKLETPYGMELRWRLPGGMHFHIHLKDNLKVKNKKRWSQVMYMSYVLDFKIKQMNVLEEDTYILTTDADINFDAESVEALLDLLMRDPSVGAVCGRTHPLGHGPLVWYQMFDYAIGHWLQKVANHVLGSVLCCPGCFSVYRAKALRDVLSLYSSTADHAVDFLTKDMGEDRWLCTLLVQAGWRLEYCAAAENHTFCPDEFDEFYKQRRRWIPSTLANLGLLISESDETVRNNDTMSFLYILYQAANVFSTLISPATVILILVGGLEYGWSLDSFPILIVLLLVTFGYALICLYTSQNFQLKVAKVLTLIFALLMSVVVVGLVIQIVESPGGNSSPTPKPATTVHPGPPINNSFVKFALPTEFNNADRSRYLKDIENSLSNKLKLYNEKTIRKPFLTKNHSTTPSSKDESSVFYELSVSSWYIIGLVSLFIVTALCHPTEAHCLVHGIWYLFCLPSGYLFLIIFSICNLTDRSWGTRENKAKTDKEESLTKLITDKLIWMCRGCKDPVQEPVAEPVKPINEVSSTSDTESSDSAIPSLPEKDEQGTSETTSAESAESTEGESAGASLDGEGSSSSSQPQSPTLNSPHSPLSKPIRSALKKSRPASPAQFRFPGYDEKKSVHFQSKLPTFKSHTPVGEWLQGKMKNLYKGNFEENGYDDTSFIGGMTDQDLKDIGIETRGHRRKLLNDIEQLPLAELDNNVPDSVDKWLTDLGLHEYWLNFKKNSYDNPKALEDLKVMNPTDLIQLINDDLEVWKAGHVKKLMHAIRKLQYPSTIERKIREARQAINTVQTRSLKDDGNGEEYEFWTRLRELRLLPESKAFGQSSELADKLADLRNSAVLCLLVVNSVWIILMYTLATKTELTVIGSNPLGLAFLVAFGFILAIQFLTMLWHRVETVLHILARTPFRAGAASLKGWAFHDEDLPPPPSEEELRKIREKRIRHSRRMRSRELVQSLEERSGEYEPLINGRPPISYHSARSKSPVPI